MLTRDLVPCFVQDFSLDSKTGYKKALLVGLFDRTFTCLDHRISASDDTAGPTHRLKLYEQYADAVLNGTKTFEIRRNDRNFKVGDKIVFDVVTNDGYSVGEAARHPLNGATYRIDYILDDFEGLAQKYVALAISKED